MFQSPWRSELACGLGGRFLRAHVLGSVSWAAPSAVNAVIGVLVVALGVWLVGAGTLTLGAVLALLRYTEVLSRPWFALGRQIRELLEAASSAIRLSDLAALRAGIADSGTLQLSFGALDVPLDHVNFGYADGQDAVLHDISFSLKPGRVLGLLGRTGSGKTTLTKLLARLHEHGGGAITLAGLPVALVRLASLRERMTLITQDVRVFSATVRENVTLFAEDVPDDRIWHALDLVGLKEWAQILPRMLDTQLMGGGSGLSAGEAQLLALARAFMRDPGLVIMDEASSRLDPATEQQLERAIDRLSIVNECLAAPNGLRYWLAGGIYFANEN